MLNRLPFELIAHIVSFLDCFSIRDLLEAVPSIRRVTVLVVCAEQQEPVQFFNIPHIRQVTLDEYIRYHWIKEAHLIKLFEVSTRDLALSPSRKLRGNAIKEWLDQCHAILDPLSFVHMDNSSFHDSLYITTSTPALKVAGLNGSKFVETWDERGRYLPEDADLTYHFDHRMYPRTCFSGLKELSITVNPEKMPVYDLDCFSLHSFSVHFIKTRSDVIPEMHFIRIPKIRFLSIHFSGSRVPLIYMISTGNILRNLDGFPKRSKFPRLELEHHYSFELCHTDGFNYKTPTRRSSATSPLPFDTTEYEKMELWFTKYFERITLVGTPESFLRFVNPEKCRVLQYHRTIEYVETISDHYRQEWGSKPASIRRSQYLAVFVFKTNLENVQMPVLSYAPILEALVIYTSAKGLKLHNLFTSTRTPALRQNSPIQSLQRLSIICDLPKDAIGGVGHPVLNHYDMLSLEAAPHLTSFHIDGCYFGENNHLLSRDYRRLGQHTPDRHARPYRLSLGLVRRQGMYLESQYNDILDLHMFGSLVSVSQVEFLQVTQLMGASKTFQPWREISLPFSTYHQKRGCQLRLSRTFERVFVNLDQLQHGSSNGSGHCKSISVWEVKSDEGEEFEAIYYQ